MNSLVATNHYGRKFAVSLVLDHCCSLLAGMIAEEVGRTTEYAKLAILARLQICSLNDQKK